MVSPAAITTRNVFHGANTYSLALQAADGAVQDENITEQVDQNQVDARVAALAVQGIGMVVQRAIPDDPNQVELIYTPNPDSEEAQAKKKICGLFSLANGTAQTRRLARAEGEEELCTAVFNTVLAVHPQFPVNLENFKARTHVHGNGQRLTGLYQHPQGFTIEFLWNRGHAPDVGLTNYSTNSFENRIRFFEDEADIGALLNLDHVARAVLQNTPRFPEE